MYMLLSRLLTRQLRCTLHTLALCNCGVRAWGQARCKRSCPARGFCVRARLWHGARYSICSGCCRVECSRCGAACANCTTHLASHFTSRALLVFSESGEPCILVRCVLRLLCNPALLSLHAQHVALRVMSESGSSESARFHQYSCTHIGIEHTFPCLFPPLCKSYLFFVNLTVFVYLTVNATFLKDHCFHC